MVLALDGTFFLFGGFIICSENYFTNQLLPFCFAVNFSVRVRVSSTQVTDIC